MNTLYQVAYDKTTNRYSVVNTKTNQVQSAGYSLNEARIICRDLNAMVTLRKAA